MAFSASFNCSQTVQTPQILTIVDTSVGSDVSIVSRRASFQKHDGSYLVPVGSVNLQYITWPLLNISQDINMLDKDYALKITVDFLDAGGNVLYTKSGLLVFTMYSEQFIYNLSQYETANPAVASDEGYSTNKNKLRSYIDSANNAITIGSDIYAAQSNLEKANNMRLNPTQFF